MASRRSFLKAGGATFALVSIGSLAGCTRLESIAGNSGGPPSYSAWLYDPETVLNVDNHLFASLNIQSFYENEEQLPAELFEGVAELDAEIDSVDLKSMKHVTVLGYGETDFSRGGMSFVVSGEFDAQAIVDEIEAEMENSSSDEELQKSSYEGYTLYSYEQPYGYSASGETESVMSGTVAIGDENLLLGLLLDAEVRSESTVKQMVQSNAGDADRYYDTNDNAKTLMAELGEATMAIGLNMEVTLLKDWVPDEETEVKAVLNDLEAMGWGATINGETTESKIVLVYDAEEAASAENVEALIERMKEEPEFEENTAEVTVSKDGRAVVITSEIDTDELWKDYQESDGGLMGGSTGMSGSGSASMGTNVEIPQVSFSFKQNSEGTATVTHDGGDHIADPLYIEYVSDGQDQFEFWMPSGSAITAGDSHTTNYAVDAGTTLSVLWTGPQGESFETLGIFRVN